MPAKLTLSNLLVGGGGLITFIFSFLKFLGGVNAWDTDGFAFASTVPAILGLVAVVWVGLELANVKLPDPVLTFNTPQLKATWGIAAFGVMLSWFTAGSGFDKGAGFWLMLLGSLAMAAGAIMGLLGIGNEALAPSSAATTSTTSSVTPPPPPPSV